MIAGHSRIALILGHPGHELRVFRFLELYKPRVYVLTDGSGSAGHSRVANTLKILRQTGAEAGPVMGRYTDERFYRILREQDKALLTDLMEEIMADMQEQHIDTLAGDAAEGFSPAHDLCRYMINSMAGMYRAADGAAPPNYEFLLEGPPSDCPEDRAGEAIRIRLEEHDFQRKFAAALDYPELRQEVERVFSTHGAQPFTLECLWPSGPLDRYKTWTTEFPFYETWGREKLLSGKYKELISYREHLLPLGKFLTNYALTHEGTHH